MMTWHVSSTDCRSGSLIADRVWQVVCRGRSDQLSHSIANDCIDSVVENYGDISRIPDAQHALMARDDFLLSSREKEMLC